MGKTREQQSEEQLLCFHIRPRSTRHWKHACCCFLIIFPILSANRSFFVRAEARTPLDCWRACPGARCGRKSFCPQRAKGRAKGAAQCRAGVLRYWSSKYDNETQCWEDIPGNLSRVLYFPGNSELPTIPHLGEWFWDDDGSRESWAYFSRTHFPLKVLEFVCVSVCGKYLILSLSLFRYSNFQFFLLCAPVDVQQYALALSEQIRNIFQHLVLFATTW